MAAMVQGPISDEVIALRRVVQAPRAAVWAAWSSAQALQAWFAPEVRMTLAVGGPFEILFMPPEAPERGSEGCRVLAFIPGRMLAFSWNAPPHLPHARGQHTWCVLELADADGGAEVRLTHTGWPAAGLAEGGAPGLARDLRVLPGGVAAGAGRAGGPPGGPR